MIGLNGKRRQTHKMTETYSSKPSLGLALHSRTRQIRWEQIGQWSVHDSEFITFTRGFSQVGPRERPVKHPNASEPTSPHLPPPLFFQSAQVACIVKTPPEMPCQSKHTTPRKRRAMQEREKKKERLTPSLLVCRQDSLPPLYTDSLPVALGQGHRDHRAEKTRI